MLQDKEGVMETWTDQEKEEGERVDALAAKKKNALATTRVVRD